MEECIISSNNKGVIMDPQEVNEPEKPSKGYGKRPMWQWVLLYVVLAVVVYGLIYLIFFHKSGTTSGY